MTEYRVRIKPAAAVGHGWIVEVFAPLSLYGFGYSWCFTKRGAEFYARWAIRKHIRMIRKNYDSYEYGVER